MRRIATFSCVLMLVVLALTAGPGRAAVRAVDGGIEFSYADPSAGSVNLAGDFNEWSTSATPMTDPDGDGVWRVVVPLAPGEHQYKFVVNGGTWIADPDNPRTGGDFGNSLVEVAKDGSLVSAAATSRATAPSGTPTTSNTPLNSKVYIGGFFRMFMEGASDVEGDSRLRLQRPDDQFNLDVTANLSPEVWGKVRLQLQTGEGGANELSTDLYKARSHFEDENFVVEAFYNDEVYSSDEPFELLGHLDLRGTIEEEHRPFGQGQQGLTLRLHPFGSRLELLYSDTYDEDIFNRTEPTVLDPRKDGLNQNTGTDVLFGRWTRPLGKGRIGLSYRGEFNDWWVNFTKEDNPLPPEIQAHLDAQTDRRDDQKSDNFEMAADRQFGAFDLSWPLPHHVGLQLAAGYGWENNRWDLGNRESLQGQALVNGPVDIGVGNQQLYRTKAVLEFDDPETSDLRVRVSHEIDYQRGMDAGESQVVYRTQPGSMVGDRDRFTTQSIDQIYQDVNGLDAVDILRLGPAPERTSQITEVDLGYRWRDWDLGLEFDRRYDDLGFSRFRDLGPLDTERWSFRTSPRVRWLPFADPEHHLQLAGQILQYSNPAVFDQVAAENLAPNLPGQGYGSLAAIESAELVLSGLLPAREVLSAPLDLRLDLRFVDYDGPDGLVDGDGNRLDLDGSYFQPFASLVYRPSPRLRVELGYGVDPSFYDVIDAQGWPNGREQWRENYLIERRLDPFNPMNVLQAEKALEDRTQIVINALVTF